MGANKVKVADLGCAELRWPSLRFLVNASRPRTGILTQSYAAPDMLLGNTKFGADADIWSLGCVAATLVLRKPLFLPSEMKKLTIKNVARQKSPDTAMLVAIRVFTKQAKVLWPPEPDSTEAKFLTSLPNVTKWFGPDVKDVFDSLTEGMKFVDEWWPPEQFEGYEPQLADLVKRALRWSPADRLSAEEARTHPYTAAPALSSTLKSAAGKNGAV